MFKKILANKALLHEILRFLIVGVAATLVDFAVSSLFQYLIYPNPQIWNVLWVFDIKASVLVSTIMGFTFGVIVNYILSIVVVFKDVENKKTSQSMSGFLIFVGLGLIGFLINLGIKSLGDMILDFDQNFLWFMFVFAFATLIVLIYNYFSRKFILFRPKENNEPNQDTK